MSSPSRMMCPLVALSRPASNPSSVLFPLPEGPMIAANSPCGIVRLMPRKISTLWVGVAIVRFRSITSMIGRGISELLGTSVMIMAVRANWIVAALLSLTLYGCGGHQQTEQSESEAAPAAIAPAPIDTRPVIVAFGDSLTAGYGVEPGKSYPDFLQRRLDTAGYRYHVVNLGVSGDTTTDGIQRLPEVLAAKPELVILEFGGNDGLRGLPVSTTRANLTQMIQSLQKSGIRILLAGMTLPRNYGSAYIH